MTDDHGTTPGGDARPKTDDEVDALLEDLGALARAEGGDVTMKERTEWRRWEALAEGRLDPDEVQALERAAQNDPEVRRRLEAFRPLSADLRRALTNRVSAATGAVDAAPRRRWRSRARSRRWAFGAAGVGLAAVAAAALLIPSTPEGPTPETPAYVLETSAGQRQLLGPEDDGAGAPATGEDQRTTPTFGPSTRLTIVLRPERRVAGPPPELDTFLEVDGRQVPWSPPIERSDSGAFRIAGEAGALLDGRSGLITLELVLRRPGEDGPLQRWKTTLLVEPAMDSP